MHGLNEGHIPRISLKIMLKLLLLIPEANELQHVQGYNCPDNKLHGANMGSIWVLSAPDGPHVSPMNFAIWVSAIVDLMLKLKCDLGIMTQQLLPCIKSTAPITTSHSTVNYLMLGICILFIPMERSVSLIVNELVRQISRKLARVFLRFAWQAH